MKKFFILPLLIVSCSNQEIKTELTQETKSEVVSIDAGMMNQTPCPIDMVEVNGSYCSSVMHHCIKGGQNHLHQKADEPMPYYCDEYKVEKIKCLGTETPVHFCIDKYEYPNKIGENPMVMIDYYDAEKLCQQQGKELCRDDKWIVACEGPEHFPYTTGFVRDKSLCNIDNPWIEPNNAIYAGNDKEAIDAEVKRMWQGVPIGSTKCESPYHVFDMEGNADEATTNYTNNYKPYKLSYHSGHWVSGARNRCRPATTSHNEYMKWYCQSFRCCRDID